jgi:hypothetical protein
MCSICIVYAEIIALGVDFHPPPLAPDIRNMESPILTSACPIVPSWMVIRLISVVEFYANKSNHNEDKMT